MAKAKTAARKRVVGKVKGAPAFSGMYVPCVELVPYARNAQIHAPAQVTALAKAMQRFGFTNPVLADADGIIAGHGRVLAAEKLYAEGASLRRPDGTPIPAGCVPVLDCSGWTDDERRAYILADNQLGKMAETDDDALRDELSYLSKIDSDLTGFAGFDDIKISEIMSSADGWAPDFAKIEKAPPAMAELTHTFKVTCNSKDQEAVKKALEKAIAKLENVSLV